MTDDGDLTAQTKRAVKRCAECGEPTTLEFVDPFDKARDRPLCVECFVREVDPPAKPTTKAAGTAADPERGAPTG
jgi:hypothetical protein